MPEAPNPSHRFGGYAAMLLLLNKHTLTPKRQTTTWSCYEFMALHKACSSWALEEETADIVVLLEQLNDTVQAWLRGVG